MLWNAVSLKDLVELLTPTLYFESCGTRRPHMDNTIHKGQLSFIETQAELGFKFLINIKASQCWLPEGLAFMGQRSRSAPGQEPAIDGERCRSPHLSVIPLVTASN